MTIYENERDDNLKEMEIFRKSLCVFVCLFKKVMFVSNLSIQSLQKIKNYLDDILPISSILLLQN